MEATRVIYLFPQGEIDSRPLFEPDPIFINLTQVELEGGPDRVERLSLNKYLIESIQDL